MRRVGHGMLVITWGYPRDAIKIGEYSISMAI